MATQVVSAHLPKAIVQEIDDVVVQGRFINRSDAIRCLLRDALTQRKTESQD